MKVNVIDHRPILGNGRRTADGLSPDPEHDGRIRVDAHDPTNAWGERVVDGEGDYPGPDALSDEAPDDSSPNATHGGGGEHRGAWPNPER